MSALPECPAFKHWDTPLEGQHLWSWQAGRCAWCGSKGRSLVEDHCHHTGLVRGLLCRGCNTMEGQSQSDKWVPWRTGDNAAAAVKHYETYVGRGGDVPVSIWSALHYYTFAERGAWCEGVVRDLKAGLIEWPAEAPWTEAAIARRDAEKRELATAIGSLGSVR